jgi:hypothetical protein
MAQQKFVCLQPAVALTASNNGAGVDVSAFEGNGYVTLNSSATGGAGMTSDVKLQHSADNGSTDAWTDTGVTFSQVTSAGASFQSQFLPLDQFKKYVRVVNTLGGTTPTVTFGVQMSGVQHNG